MIEEPVFTINLAALAGKIGPEGDPSDFKPSALGLHPIPGHLYVLSSVRKVSAVLNREGALEAVWSLSDKLFRPPESLAFLPNGDLFIASESHGKKAALMRFIYRS